jgi:hypothetical protein
MNKRVSLVQAKIRKGGPLMMLRRHFNKLRTRHVLALGTAMALLPIWAASGAEEKIFETNVTNDLNVSSGEPEIAVDPTDPKRLAIIEFGIGSAEAPASTYFAVPGHADPTKMVAGAKHDGRVMLSTDGGNHWHQAPGRPPASNPKSQINGGSDVMTAIGPDGTIYAADEPGPDSLDDYKPAGPMGLPDLSKFHFLIAASTDHGKSFGAPQDTGTPVDRPWMTVDQSTGTVYTVSSGFVDVKTGTHNLPGPGAINDRWLIAWEPHLAGKSEPRRIGGPDFSGSGGNTITAANGVVAATFVIGAGFPGGFGGTPAPVPVPASLKSIVKDGTTSCSVQASCLFFETSTDQGEHWTRHHVPGLGGFSGFYVNVSADPGRPGHYAIGVLNTERTKFSVLVTDDSGATWSAPVAVPETAQGVDFKQWMAFGPSGVLGLMWKKERTDFPAPKSSVPQNIMFSVSPGFDVYAGISCDGGKTWLPPVRVNAVTSPGGPNGRDDLSYVALDAHYAHLVWGDRRDLPKVKNMPMGSGGIQVYYGRVPFSLVSKGAACGRS